jgi:L-malate glycosyltransferase
MKVLQFIQQPQLRGAEIFACQLSEMLNAKGHEVVIVVLFPGTVSLPFSGKIIYLNLSKTHRLWDFQAWWKIARIVRQEKPDLVQANAGDTLKYCILSKILFRWRCKVIFRNASMVSLYIKKNYTRLLNATFYYFTSAIISVSEFTKRDIEKLIPSVRGKTFVIPIGIEEKSLGSYPTNDDPQKFVILHIGGFTFEKNHQGVLRIFKKVTESIANAELWLVGDGPLRHTIEQSVREGNLNNVFFLGFRPDPYKFLKQASVLILPSIIEGLPAVILEAFYAKIPVVAYGVGGVAEVVKNNETGWLIERGNEEDFATAILSIAERPDPDIIQNANNLVTGHYTLSRVSEQFITAYSSLIE